MERAGRLAGVRFFGQNDWYRQGAEELVHDQKPLSGFWRGAGAGERAGRDELRAPVPRQGPRTGADQQADPPPRWRLEQRPRRRAQPRRIVSRDWKSLLTWQIVDPTNATVQDLLQAPILFFNGHRVPEFSASAKQSIREYLDQGGFLFVDACCGDPEFDRGFRRLIEEILPPPEFVLRPLSAGAPGLAGPSTCSRPRSTRSGASSTAAGPWRSTRPGTSPATGTRRRHSADEPGGHPGDQDRPERRRLRHRPRDARRQAGRPRGPRLQQRRGAQAGALRIAKLMHAGDWNIAPQAIPNLMDALRKPPFSFNVVLTRRTSSPATPT